MHPLVDATTGVQFNPLGVCVSGGSSSDDNKIALGSRGCYYAAFRFLTIKCYKFHDTAEHLILVNIPRVKGSDFVFAIFVEFNVLFGDLDKHVYLHWRGKTWVNMYPFIGEGKLG